MKRQPDKDDSNPGVAHTRHPRTQAAPLGDLRTHYWLALEMSQTVGLDLQAEMQAGRLTSADWADAVTKCRGCDWSGECPAWMKMQQLEAQLDTPAATPPEAPAACANADRFNALRPASALGESAAT